MNYEEITSIWNKSDMQLEQSMHINKKLLKELSVRKIKTGLYEIKLEAILELIINPIFFFFLIGFMVDHFFELKFFIPALILFTITAFSMAFEIYRLRMLYSINSKDPVLNVQKKLTKLRNLEILDVRSLYVIIPLFSAPFLIVITKAFLNLSLYDFNLTWLIYFTLGSVVIAAIIVFILLKFPDKKLQESIAFLNELNENDK